MYSLGQSFFPVPSSKHLNSLRVPQRLLLGLVRDLSDYCGIPKDLALNVVTYAKTLEKFGSGYIDQNIFDAQMVRHFDIHKQATAKRMYQATKRIGESNVDRCKISREVTVDEYAKLVGLFLSDAEERKLEFVFSVYDIHCAGELSATAVQGMIKEGVFQTFSDDIHELDAISSDLYEILMNVFDIKQNGSITLMKFKEIGRKNPLFTEVLGRCLPNANAVVRFLKKIENKLSVEVAASFRNERKRSLNADPKPAILPMYPIDLELPLDFKTL